MRRRLALAITLLAAAPAARADELESSLGQQLGEAGHEVAVTFADGTVGYQVTRRLRNAGLVAEEAVLRVTLPPGAAVTGLRLRVGEEWQGATLADVAEAARRYAGETDLDPAPAALLTTQGPGAAELRVYPVPPGGLATVSYALVGATAWENGQLVAYYPEAETSGMAVPRIKATTDSSVLIERDATCPDSGAKCARMVVPPPRRHEPTGRLAARSLSLNRTVWRLEIDAPAALSAAPIGAHVVFVLDASITEGAAGVRAQLALIRAYLAELPDARFEIVAFRRRAERLIGGFAEAERADVVLAGVAARLAPGNGSHLDAGLGLAADALANWTGPARIVVLSDTELRSAFTVDNAARLLDRAPAGTLLHVVEIDGAQGPTADERLDDHPLSPLAAGTGGITLRASAADAAGWRAITRGLVRPVRIDGFTLEAPGLEDLDAPTALAEGQAVRQMALSASVPRVVTARGHLWAKPWSLAIPRDAAFTARLPALALGGLVAYQLADQEVADLAHAGGVASSATSFVVDLPGARPPRPEALGTMSSGSGSSSGSSVDTVTISCHARPRNEEFLLTELASRVADCAARTGATVTFETTRDEIVDVRVTGVGDEAAACLTEAAWTIRLDDRFAAPRQQLSVTLP